uniref:SHSP domain-containing protein n=1 Tax=Oryzias latipes TaxID=8090 RepID=A0A3P9KIR3_ORYLA
MLCSRGLHSDLSPSMFFFSPVRSLWPEVRPLFYQRDLLQRNLQELRSSLELMDKFQDKILEETEPFQSSVTLQPVSFQLDKDGQHFGLTLDTRGFSPEELSVRQVGRKLRVSGKTEKKQEDGKGSYSYRLQEFRQELDLPEGLNPEAVTCCLSPDGKLHIQAAKEDTRNFLNSPPLLLSEYKAGTESLLRQKDTQKRKDNSTSFHLPTKRLKT